MFWRVGDEAGTSDETGEAAGAGGGEGGTEADATDSTLDSTSGSVEAWFDYLKHEGCAVSSTRLRRGTDYPRKDIYMIADADTGLKYRDGDR